MKRKTYDWGSRTLTLNIQAEIQWNGLEHIILK